MWDDSKPSDIDMKIMYVNALKYLLLILPVSHINVASVPFESNRSNSHM